MALYAFDGTGNEDRDGDDRDSNVLDFFRAYDDPLKNDDPGKDLGMLRQTGHRFFYGLEEVELVEGVGES